MRTTKLGIELAWSIIANASGGNWLQESADWQEAATRWRDQYVNEPDLTAEALAKSFHEAYERLAGNFNYATRPESSKPWEEVPQSNKLLMIAVCREMLAKHFEIPTDLDTLNKDGF